ncbi:MAG: glycosyltransferase family 39 protein [Alphaproteobacteria bacterium]|nr:glycosyltransferase family 39 protein [Alphaproteobacteria bacterium]
MQVLTRVQRLVHSRWGAISILVLLAALLMLRGLGDNSIGYPDADRILMDGVFLADTMRDMPFSDPWGYAQAYFVQYPGLSIGYRPPFFPAVEGLFNLVFGINMWSSRLALFLFVMVGIYYWYRLAESLADKTVAFWSSALWISTPFLAQWGWYTMAELAVLSMALAAIYYLHQWIATGRLSDAFLMALFIGVAGWTKQTAAFLALVVLAYLLAQGRLLWALKRPGHWGAFALLVVITVPLAAITLAFGDQNVHQSVGQGDIGSVSRWSFENWGIHIGTLTHMHLTLPVMAACLLGVASAIYGKLRLAVLPVVAILSVFVFFSMLMGKNPRYPIFWIPFWCFFAALPFALPRMKDAVRIAFHIALASIVVFQAYSVFEKKPAFVTGYDKAAQIAVREADTPGIFVDAFNNGYFTYFTRQADKGRSHYVFRGDKLLSSSSISTQHWLEVHMESEEDILKAFDELAVSVIVVESINYAEVQVHDVLRKMLEGPNFERIATIDIESNRRMSSVTGMPWFEDQQLFIYRYLNAKSEMSGEITLRLPVVGQDVSKSFEKND